VRRLVDRTLLSLLYFSSALDEGASNILSRLVVDAFCQRIRRRMSSRLRDEPRLTNRKSAARFSLRLEAR
jgi:hypothetical protein